MNMGASDRAIRMLAAIGVAILYFMHAISGTTAIVLQILDRVFLLTSIISICPLYSLFDIRTCEAAK